MASVQNITSRLSQVLFQLDGKSQGKFRQIVEPFIPDVSFTSLTL